MSRPPPPPPRKGSPDKRFREQIETAVAEGVSRDDMVLRLTLGDANAMTRDKATPVADISFVGGVMRFLGVKVEKGGTTTSALDRGEA